MLDVLYFQQLFISRNNETISPTHHQSQSFLEYRRRFGNIFDTLLPNTPRRRARKVQTRKTCNICTKVFSYSFRAHQMRPHRRDIRTDITTYHTHHFLRLSFQLRDYSKLETRCWLNSVTLRKYCLPLSLSTWNLNMKGYFG
jgi:hypothetical protein